MMCSDRECPGAKRSRGKRQTSSQTSSSRLTVSTLSGLPLLLATLTDLLALCPTATIYFCFKKRRRADLQLSRRPRRFFKWLSSRTRTDPCFRREGLFLFAFTNKW